MNRKIRSKKQEKAQAKVVNPKILIITSIVFVVILVGGLLFDQIYKRALITVDGDKLDLQDLSYYFYTVENQYEQYDQMFGGQYWDMSYDETTGATMRDAAKQEAIESALYTEILYREAVDEDYALTAEETDTVSTNVDALLGGEQLSKAVISKNDFTKKYLTDITSKLTLASRYRQEKIDALNIDDEGIKAGFAFEDYKQYDIQTLFISTQTTDAEGTSVAVSADEKTAAFDKINALYESAKTTEDWSTLIPEGEEQLVYKEDQFLESETTFSDEFEAVMMAMENNTISDVYEAENGYYIVRMVNNNSSESYDTAVADAITSAENEGFNTIYQEVIAKHEYSINDTILRSLTMGSITLAD
ncbi:MAG: SurA N-terminal domain-containing protein [Mobilitalea sp.]